MYQNLNYLILVSKTGWLKIILIIKKKSYIIHYLLKRAEL